MALVNLFYIISPYFLVCVSAKIKLFWFFVSAVCVGEKPKVLKGVVGFRFVANNTGFYLQDSNKINIEQNSMIKLQIKSSWTKPPEDQGVTLWGFNIVGIGLISLKSDINAAKSNVDLQVCIFDKEKANKKALFFRAAICSKVNIE